MRHLTAIHLCALAAYLCFASSLSRAEDNPPWAGIWGIWGQNWNYPAEDYPWLKGSMIHGTWRDLEPVDGRFDFSSLERSLRAAAANNRYVSLKVYIAPDLTPEWVYEDFGVPRILLKTSETWVEKGVHPYYLHPAFRAQFKEMIQALAGWVDDLPPDLRGRVVMVQAAVGKSGDPQPYMGSGEIDPAYDIPNWPTNPAWRDYNREMFQAYYDAFSRLDPSVILIAKPMQNNEAWARENLPTAGRKTFSVGQAFHLGGETQWNWQADALRPGATPVLRARSEFDLGPSRKTAWFLQDPLWNTYWTALWNLTYGVDVWHQVHEILDLQPQPHVKAFEFFNRYAGQKDPARATGAWIAFRDDLDNADLERFPEADYGAFEDGRNADRILRLAEAFAPFGARLDDPENATLRQLDIVRRARGFNDVQTHVFRGNYGMHLRQINTDATSQGYWRVGPRDQPYGRFARGFHHESKRDAILLDLDDAFFVPSTTARARALTLRIVYFDEGVGSWALRYTAQAGLEAEALRVRKTGTGRWITIEVAIPDAVIDNRGPCGSDFALVNVDEEDDIFHRIEVLRETPGCGTRVAADNAASTATFVTVSPGETSDAGPVTVGSDGAWSPGRRPNHADWLLVLEGSQVR